MDEKKEVTSQEIGAKPFETSKKSADIAAEFLPGKGHQEASMAKPEQRYASGAGLGDGAETFLTRLSENQTFDEARDGERNAAFNKADLTERNLELHQQQMINKQEGVAISAQGSFVGRSGLVNFGVHQSNKQAWPQSGSAQQAPQITIPIQGGGQSRPLGQQSSSRPKKASAYPQSTQPPTQDSQSNMAQIALSQSARPGQAPQSSQPQPLNRQQMTNEQYLQYQQQQQQRQQQFEQMQQHPHVGGLSQGIANVQGPTTSQPTSGLSQPSQMVGSVADPNVQRLLHHQQVHQASQSVSLAQQQHENNQQKMIEQTIRTRIQMSFNEKIAFLQAADKQHNDNLTKEIKREERKFFMVNDDTRYNKHSLLEQKNQRMDEYIAFCAENGGRVIPKQPEPVPPPHETPYVVEMRLVHMDFVEEAYWKRLQASQLARQCQVKAMQLAKQRAAVREEERQRNLVAEEQRKRQEEIQASQAAKGFEASASNRPTPSPVKAEVSKEAGKAIALEEGRFEARSGAKDQRAGGALAFSDLEPEEEFRRDMVDEGGFFGDDLELMSMGGGLGINGDAAGLAKNTVQALPFGEQNDEDMREALSEFGGGEDHFHYDVDDHDHDQFDPEKELLRLEAIREQQTIEEIKMQEADQMLQVEEIQAAEPASEDDAKTASLDAPKRRVYKNIFDDSDMSEAENSDYLSQLEQKILNIEMAYVQTDDDPEFRQRMLKPDLEEGRDGKRENAKAASDGAEEQTTTNSLKQRAVHQAKNAVKQKFDRLGQLLIEEGMTATEVMQSAQFEEALASHAEAIKRPHNSDLAQMNEVFQMLLRGDDQIGIYTLAGIEDYDFDSEKEFDDEERLEYECEDDAMMDIDGFFSEVKDPAQREKSLKLRPPSVLGDEQKKLYRELQEISSLAPERNDLTYMEHLCEFWTERLQEEISEKKVLKEIYESNLDHDNQKSLRHFQTLIDEQRQHIEMRTRNLEKHRRPEYQPKELHKEKFLLSSGSEHPQPQQSGLAPQEFSFIKWYYALFPDQWRLIADIINYHPLTRGTLRCKEFMWKEYFNRLDSNHKDLLQNRQKIQMQPWRETKLPWLINGRESCLMNSTTYLNKSHLQSIHMINVLSRRQRSAKKTFSFAQDERGCLQLLLVETKARNSAGCQVHEQSQISLPELAGIKRTRADADTDEEDSIKSGGFLSFGERHYSEIDIHERLLEQMLARRRKAEIEEQIALERGSLLQEDIFADRPFLKELMVDITYKRKRTDENSSQIVPKYNAFAYSPTRVRKDELDQNTPMWYALQQLNSCQTTIQMQNSTMFWLGYFIRRIMHEENLEKLKMINLDRLAVWESENEIKNYFINQAKKIRLEQEALDSEEHQAREASKEREKREYLLKAINHFIEKTAQNQNESRVEIKEVNDLWEGKSPYHYVREQRQEYIKQEKESEQRISNVMYQKSRQLWDELQYYWFQVNKNLHPRYRKDAVNSDSQQILLAQQQQQQRLAIAASVEGASSLAQGVHGASQMQPMGSGMTATQQNSVIMAQRSQQQMMTGAPANGQNMLQIGARPPGQPGLNQLAMQPQQLAAASLAQSSGSQPTASQPSFGGAPAPQSLARVPSQQSSQSMLVQQQQARRPQQFQQPQPHTSYPGQMGPDLQMGRINSTGPSNGGQSQQLSLPQASPGSPSQN